jgi:ribonuclease HII
MNALQRHDKDQLKGADWLVGIDEAGRGALAGPVVAGACVLARQFFESKDAVRLSAEINDSKQLTGSARETQLQVIQRLHGQGLLDFEVGIGSVEEIAEHNILGATRLAMRRAVELLAARASGWQLPLFALSGPLFDALEAGGVRIIVDGRPLKPFPYSHEGIVKGDGKSLVIAMASIAAKVTRDREMHRLAETYPQYDFAQHKGYGTATHRAAINTHGASAIHRELFLRKVLKSR